MFGNIGGKIHMFLLLFSLPVHPTHPKIEKRGQLYMLRQSLTRTSLRASSLHAPFGGYRSWIVTYEGLAKGDERAKGIFSRLASLVIQIGELWSPVPSPYQSSDTQLKVFPQPCRRLDCKISLFLSFSSQNRFSRGESNAHLMRIAGVSTPKAGDRAYFHLRSSWLLAHSWSEQKYGLFTV